MRDEGESPNYKANAMFQIYHCCIQMVDKKWPVPPFSSNLWMACCMKPAEQVNAYHMLASFFGGTPNTLFYHIFHAKVILPFRFKKYKLKKTILPCGNSYDKRSWDQFVSSFLCISTHKHMYACAHTWEHHHHILEKLQTHTQTHSLTKTELNYVQILSVHIKQVKVER